MHRSSFQSFGYWYSAKTMLKCLGPCKAMAKRSVRSFLFSIFSFLCLSPATARKVKLSFHIKAIIAELFLGLDPKCNPSNWIHNDLGERGTNLYARMHFQAVCRQLHQNTWFSHFVSCSLFGWSEHASQDPAGGRIVQYCCGLKACLAPALKVWWASSVLSEVDIISWYHQGASCVVSIMPLCSIGRGRPWQSS